MPNAYDPRGRQLTVTHDPTKRLPLELGKLPPFNLADIFVDALATVLEMIKDATGIDLTSWTAFFDSIDTQTGVDLTSLLDQLLAIPLQFLDQIPLAAISSGVGSNFLANPIFDPHAIDDAVDWVRDATKTHSDLTTYPDAGSVKVTADGYEHSLYSNRMGVVAGQEVPMSIWVDWAGLTADAEAIRLLVAPFDTAGDELESVPIETIVSPLADAPAWTQLAGEYTVPAGVAEVSMLLHVDATATGGTVWFSDGVLDKDIVGNIAPLEWVENLIPSLGGLEQYTQDLIDAGIGVVTGVFGSGSTIEDWVGEFVSWFDDTQTTAGQASDALANGVDIVANMFNTWFGLTSATGDTAEVAETFTAVRAAVAGGYMLQTFTANNAAWAVPTALRTAAEAFAVAVGGGGKGTAGAAHSSDTFAPGGVGGNSGGFLAVKIDPTTLASTLEIAVGAAASTAGGSGGLTRIKSGATTLVESTADIGAMAQTVGFASSTSMPGRGGKGGDVSAGGTPTAGSAGTPSATGSAGAGGASAQASTSNVTAAAGGAGENGVYTTAPLCGGGGGGGGGGAETGGFATAHGGNGGNGGFPGGGSGGGGAAGGFTDDPGSPGVPGNGLAALLWR